MEISLRESEERKGYILKLNDALRHIEDPVQIKKSSCSVLGQHLDRDVAYESKVNINCGYVCGSVNGIFTLMTHLNTADFNQFTNNSYKSGIPVIIKDMCTNLRLTKGGHAAYASISVAANISLGLIKNGKWVAAFGVHNNENRNWSSLEISLLEETAQRTWEAVERAKADEALRRSEAKYRTIFETAQEGIWVIDSNDKTILVNNKLQQILGYSFDEFVGQSPQVFMAPEFQVKACDRLSEHVRGIAHVLDYKFIKKDGNPLWCILSSTPLFDRNGKFDGSIAMIIDISERKRAEEDLYESERLANELVKVLDEADKSKNKFISVLSHELRNPLATISVGLSVLEASTDKQQAKSVKDTIKRQVNQLCRLVDDMLDLSRFSSNKFILRKENFILNDIIMNSIADIKPEFDKKCVQISKKILSDPIYSFCDPIRIAQCIGNLLHNAVKFTPANGNVWISLKQENHIAIISIQDDGIGISKKILKRLFQPFTQADDSPERYNNNGLGLGLSIVKGIVELHNGIISATSEGLGKGSLFTMHLPIASGKSEKLENTVLLNACQRLRILIIEDNKDLADLLHSMFSILGHETYTVYNGIDGIAEARRITPDIIFCDIGLPGNNGLVVAKIIRKEANLKNVRLIALTGYAGEHDVENAKKCGFDRHLAKPIDLETLKQVLSEEIENF